MSPKKSPDFIDVTPSAARLTESLRDIGYDFSTAVADLIDNAVAAEATTIAVDIVHDGERSFVAIGDDGCGMTANQLLEAFRFGTRRDYELGQLGRYGLGLKTASLSQARRVTVVSKRRSEGSSPTVRRTLDLDTVIEWDQWLIIEAVETPPVEAAVARLVGAHGTTVVWELLDRIIPASRLETGHARRRIETLTTRLKLHLAMVFHRFLEGDTADSRPITITVNGEKLVPWNPFALDEPDSLELPPLRFDLDGPVGLGQVRLRRHILPGRDAFSSMAEFDRMSGPLKWNRQQGLYVYRADRLVQWGGWAGLRAIDEHTKLARAALEFDTDLDALFNINVAKMRISVPSGLRPRVEAPLKELCILASDTYRSSVGSSAVRRPEPGGGDSGSIGLALQVAAMELGMLPDLERLFDFMGERDPELARSLRLARGR